MNFNRPPIPEKKELPKKVRVLVDSETDAAKLIEEFWRAMPHGGDLVRQLEQDKDPDWLQQLTFGDRTQLRRSVQPDEKGKTVVLFMGNNDFLSKEAIAWLRERNFLQDP